MRSERLGLYDRTYGYCDWTMKDPEAKTVPSSQSSAVAGVSGPRDSATEVSPD